MPNPIPTDKDPLFGWPATIESLRPFRDAYRVTSAATGTYEISDHAARQAPDIGYDERLEYRTLTGQDLTRLLTAIRLRTDVGSAAEVNSTNAEDLIRSVRPLTPLEQVDRAIEILYGRTAFYGDEARFDLETDFPYLVVPDPRRANQVMELANDLGFAAGGHWRRDVKTRSQMPAKLTLKGWQRYDELHRAGRGSARAFVAMRFDDEYTPAYANGIAPALEAAGWTPYKVDDDPAVDWIVPKIMAGVRSSGLLVADISEQRGGIYFEAGFAMGLGLPVIFTCREDRAAGVHFDLAQMQQVRWNTPDDLRTKLAVLVSGLYPAPAAAG